MTKVEAKKLKAGNAVITNDSTTNDTESGKSLLKNKLETIVRNSDREPLQKLKNYIFFIYSLRKQNWPRHNLYPTPPWKKNLKKNCALLLRIQLRSFCRKSDRAGVIVYTVAYKCTQAWFSKFRGRGQLEVTIFTITKMRTKQWTKEEKRVALELWRVGTSQAHIRARLQMPKRTLRRLIAADRPSAAAGLPVDIPDWIPEVAGWEHAQEDGGGHWEGWKYDQVLNKNDI